MRKVNYRWVLLGMICLLLVLILTNPTRGRMRKHLKAEGMHTDKGVGYWHCEDCNEKYPTVITTYYIKQEDYIIFSIYIYTSITDTGSIERTYYFGMLYNLFECGKKSFCTMPTQEINNSMKSGIPPRINDTSGMTKLEKDFIFHK